MDEADQNFRNQKLNLKNPVLFVLMVFGYREKPIPFILMAFGYQENLVLLNDFQEHSIDRK
jgi:hypothetical protein